MGLNLNLKRHNFSQQINLNFDYRFYYNDVFKIFCNFRFNSSIFNHSVHNIFINNFFYDFTYFYDAGIHWIGKQFELNLTSKRLSLFDSLNDFSKLSTFLYYAFLTLLIMKILKKKSYFLSFRFLFISSFLRTRIRFK